jgi:hypothetical protein
MNHTQIWFRNAVLLSVLAALTACGGGESDGGSFSETVNASSVTNPDDPNVASRMMTFSEDIEPIMLDKCIGCHTEGTVALAPLSLEGIDRVNSLKSAIQHALENGSMPPEGSVQLSQGEYNKFMAWLNGTPYTPSAELVRVALIEARAWDTTSKNRDVFLSHRPEEVQCAQGTGWLVEEDALEIRTASCNYLSLTQQSLLNMASGTVLELAMSHSDLNFNAPSSAHVALSIAGTTIWETTIPIPSPANILKVSITLPFAIAAGDSIDLHLDNHGSNAWSVYSLDALISEDIDLEFCASFDSTWEAIQAVAFEKPGCTNSLCHGAAAAGGLDLSPDVAYNNLVGVTSESSSLQRVAPREHAVSYLYHKLAEKTFPGNYAISGSPMPVAGPGLSADALKAIVFWIEAGAPETGSVGDSIGRGEDEIERLLGVCLPEADPVNTIALPPPERDVGLQFSMPPHPALAEQENEWCFAVYEDFRDIIPPEYMSPDREFFYVRGDEVREDGFTHHSTLLYSGISVEDIHDPSFGEWSCVGGSKDTLACEPTDAQSCDTGRCRSELQDSVACIGFGPAGGPIAGLGTNVGSYLTQEGFFETFRTYGIFYWNSHYFNLSTKDGAHHAWRNLFYTNDRQFDAEYFTNSSNISAGAGTPPFENRTVCRDYVLAEGDGLIYLSSHTHRRGKHFTVSIKGGEQIYESFAYDEPLDKLFSPHMVFNSPDPADRTLEYCSTYNNGVNADGSFNLDTVTRASFRPANASDCQPIACVTGKVAAACSGADDDASCDSEPGAKDGWCDACAITSGLTSDDEMFVLLGATMADYDMIMSQPTTAGSDSLSENPEQ